MEFETLAVIRTALQDLVDTCAREMRDAQNKLLGIEHQKELAQNEVELEALNRAFTEQREVVNDRMDRYDRAADALADFMCHKFR